MKIYISGVPTKGGIPPAVLQKTAKYCSNTGATILSNIASLANTSLSVDEIAEADARGEALLDRMDAFVVDGTVSNPEIAYIVAYALFRRKSLLYLLPRGRSLDPTLALLAKRKENQRYFLIRYHIPQTLFVYVEEFLKLLSPDSERSEVPSIKFTLRITPHIDQYLNWRTQKEEAQKADFVRKLIEDELKNDTIYQKEKKK